MTSVEWNCFSCGKFLGSEGDLIDQPDGGSFVLTFGYGSKFDGFEDIAGYICDECVTQKHGRLRIGAERYPLGDNVKIKKTYIRYRSI